ncbi:hypothetical protein AB0G15_37295, partial [Streptosporangium sp. NPDC023825]|uniref:hypothetical protein n=1 Tax=Streptosporangium sp. NPDC023825 TaxID=3154909 RepID=UPI00344A9A6F
MSRLIRKEVRKLLGKRGREAPRKRSREAPGNGELGNEVRELPGKEVPETGLEMPEGPHPTVEALKRLSGGDLLSHTV